MGKRELVALLICLPGVSWWLSGSSSRCHGVVWGLWLWYFLIILTYYFFLLTYVKFSRQWRNLPTTTKNYLRAAHRRWLISNSVMQCASAKEVMMGFKRLRRFIWAQYQIFNWLIKKYFFPFPYAFCNQLLCHFSMVVVIKDIKFGKYYRIHDIHIWAATWDFQKCGMCDQQCLKSACAYAQSDQSHC